MPEPELVLVDGAMVKPSIVTLEIEFTLTRVTKLPFLDLTVKLSSKLLSKRPSLFTNATSLLKILYLAPALKVSESKIIAEEL